MIGGALTPAKKIQAPEQPLMDLKVTGGEYGQAIPYLMGTMMVAGQMWWNTDRRAITTTTRSGGGKGSRKPVVETKTTIYEFDALYGLTDNEIVGVSRIWANGKLIYNNRSDADPATVAASLAYTGWDRMTVYTGAASQTPDPDYEAAVGAANAPAYRGRGSVFIKGLKLGTSGQIPNLTFEVVAGPLAPAGVDFVLTAGNVLSPSGSPSAPYLGFATTFFTGQTLGALSPSSYLGQTVTDLLVQHSGGGGDHVRVTINGLLAQTFFTTLIVNGVSYPSASAIYSQFGGVTIWRWTVGGGFSLPFTTTGTYAARLE